MKFKFGYQKLLEHRKTLEELAQRAFGAAQGDVIFAERELSDMYALIDQTRERIHGLERAGGPKSGEIITCQEFIVGQGLRIERQKQKIKELMMIAEEKQQLLIEAAREFKVLEKLREKRLGEHRNLLKKHELKLIDEQVTMRHARRDGI